MRDYVQGFFAREAYPGARLDMAMADDAGHPDIEPPTEEQMDRAFRAASRELPALFCVSCERETPMAALTPAGFCPTCCGCGNCIEGQHHPCPARD